MAKKSRRVKVEDNATPAWYSVLKWMLGICAAVVLPLVMMFIFFVMILAIVSADDNGLNLDANVAVISIKGTIVADKTSGGFGFSGTSATDVIKLIKKVEEDDNMKAVIFEINSPGGTAVASAEIAREVLEMKKPTVAVIRETGASGAFWIATAADDVFAHPISITGSIGVISSYLEFSGVLEEYNVTYQRLVAGSRKDAGSPFKKLTENEREAFQQKIDVIHDEFIAAVARNRNLTTEQVKEVADGFVFLGSEAKELGFVDYLGSMRDAENFLGKKLNITVKTKRFKVKAGLLEALGAVSSGNFYAIGQGLGDSLTKVDNNYVPKLVI